MSEGLGLTQIGTVVTTPQAMLSSFGLVDVGSSTASPYSSEFKMNMATIEKLTYPVVLAKIWEKSGAALQIKSHKHGIHCNIKTGEVEFLPSANEITESEFSTQVAVVQIHDGTTIRAVGSIILGVNRIERLIVINGIAMPDDNLTLSILSDALARVVGLGWGIKAENCDDKTIRYRPLLSAHRLIATLIKSYLPFEPMKSIERIVEYHVYEIISNVVHEYC